MCARARSCVRAPVLTYSIEHAGVRAHVCVRACARACVRASRVRFVDPGGGNDGVGCCNDEDQSHSVAVTAL